MTWLKLRSDAVTCHADPDSEQNHCQLLVPFIQAVLSGSALHTEPHRKSNGIKQLAMNSAPSWPHHEIALASCRVILSVQHICDQGVIQMRSSVLGQMQTKVRPELFMVMRQKISVKGKPTTH